MLPKTDPNYSQMMLISKWPLIPSPALPARGTSVTETFSRLAELMPLEDEPGNTRYCGGVPKVICWPAKVPASLFCTEPAGGEIRRFHVLESGREEIIGRHR